MNAPTVGLAVCAVAFDAHVANVSGDGKANWMKILPAGVVSGRDGRGPYMVGDVAAMQTIVDRTLRRAGGTELMVDYDHQSIFGARDGVGGTAKAAGWVKRLQARQDGIWAQIEWTDVATAAIRAKEYRYLSPTFGQDRNGRVTSLLNVALTNMPNMDELTAIAASWTQLKGTPMEQIAQLLGLAQGAGQDQILAALSDLVATRAKLMTAAGLAPDGNPDDAAAAIAKAMQSPQDKPNPASFVPFTEFERVVKEANELRSGISRHAAETRVDQNIQTGKMAPFLRDWAVNLCTVNAAAYENFVQRTAGTMSSLFEPQLGTSARPARDGKSLSGDEQAVCASLGLSADEFNKSRPRDGLDQE